MRKVFGIGACRTGGTSLEYILRATGLSVLPDQFGIDRVGDYWKSYKIVALSLTDTPYDGFVGMPWNLGQFYRELAERYPEAKFVLTTRPGKEWVASLRRFTKRCRPFIEQLAAKDVLKSWGQEFHASGLAASNDELIEAYRKRCRDIEAFFKDTGRLFVLDWRNFRWGPLCDFLGVDCVPAGIMVPHLRRWEQVPGGAWRYAAAPSHSYGPDEDVAPLPTINFTVSTWNRTRHLVRLLENFKVIANVDPRIAVRVCYFDGDDADPNEVRRLVEELPCPSSMAHCSRPFNNGFGHNLAASDIIPEDIVCPVCVDLRMPVDITTRIRANTAPGTMFYGPKVNNEDETGRLHMCNYAYSLVSMFGVDYEALGGFAQNKKWGGDNDEHPEGGEDVQMCRRLMAMGLEQRRPFERDLICRWHPRDITTEFYSSLKRYGKKPWWTFTNQKGELASFDPN